MFFQTFERECDDLRKGLQAKEQQLQTYRTVGVQFKTDNTIQYIARVSLGFTR